MLDPFVSGYSLALDQRKGSRGMKEVISAELRAFILEYIESVAELEAILLMSANREIGWTPSKIASRLYIDEQKAIQVLGRIEGAGLCRAFPDGCRYEPKDDTFGRLVEELATAYARSLVAVTTVIHEKPRITKFADAFRFRKER